jgi:hypothetical protein
MMLRRQGDRRQHHHGGYDETCKLAHVSTLLQHSHQKCEAGLRPKPDRLIFAAHFLGTNAPALVCSAQHLLAPVSIRSTARESRWIEDTVAIVVAQVSRQHGLRLTTLIVAATASVK